jgi:hypothetical protein
MGEARSWRREGLELSFSEPCGCNEGWQAVLIVTKLEA